MLTERLDLSKSVDRDGRPILPVNLVLPVGRPEQSTDSSSKLASPERSTGSVDRPTPVHVVHVGRPVRSTDLLPELLLLLFLPFLPSSLVADFFDDPLMVRVNFLSKISLSPTLEAVVPDARL